MLKKLVLSSALGLAVVTAYAVESEVSYSYVGDELTEWGKGKSEVYDVAIRISDPALIGKKITSMRALINAYEGVEATSVWLSRQLVIEKVDGVKVNVPDVCSVDVAVEKVSRPDTDGFCGQLSATFDTPYVLTDEGVYIGYSLTVPSAPKGGVLTPMQKEPILLSPCDIPESLYIRASKDILKWMPYNDRVASAAVIYVTLEGEFAEYCVGIKSLSASYAAVDEPFSVKADLSNIGGMPVSAIGYTYSLGGKAYEASIDLDQPILPDFINSTVVDLPITAIPEVGKYILDLEVASVNGGRNSNLSAKASVPLVVLPFVPVHRPMLEEFTGTWCGWCPRGYIAMEALREAYGDGVVLAAYHASDPMEVTLDYPVDVEAYGFPAATLNRNGVEDPYLGKKKSGFAMKTQVELSMETMVAASVELSADWVDDAKTSVKVSSTAVFLEEKEDAGFRIGYLLIADGLTGKGGAWAQSNYFAGVSGYKGTELEVLTGWDSKVAGLIFNDVVVDASGSMGVEGSLPSDVAYNTPYSSEFRFDIAGNSVIQDKDSLYVAAFIINPDGTILNSNKVKVGGDSAVDAVEAEVYELSSEYHTLTGMRVSYPEKGVFVKVSHLSDGSFRTSKVINH